MSQESFNITFILEILCFYSVRKHQLTARLSEYTTAHAQARFRKSCGRSYVLHAVRKCLVSSHVGTHQMFGRHELHSVTARKRNNENRLMTKVRLRVLGSNPREPSFRRGGPVVSKRFSHLTFQVDIKLLK